MLAEPEDGDLGVAIALKRFVRPRAGTGGLDEFEIDALAEGGDGVGAERLEHLQQLLLVGLGGAGLELGDADGHAGDL